VKAPIDADVAQDAEEELDEAADSDGAEDAAEPPRRRLVAELLEGQEVIDEASRADLQLVAPPLHLETIDAGQPIYQLDLSSDEPQGEIIEPEAAPGAADTGHAEAPYGADSLPLIPADADAREAVRQMIVQRDRQVMAAERDGIGAYDLAVGVDPFVEALLEAARRDEG
jgi:hypothetical protein